MRRSIAPELLLVGNGFETGRVVVVDESGMVQSIGAASEHPEALELPGRAMLPGLVNAHSHAFQRAIRGTAESRQAAGSNFWSWRDAMYAAANGLDAAGLYAVARMAFLEMALSGITSVGEFHYLHNHPDGTPYEDPNYLSFAVIRAAREVGLRICLLRVAYARAGFQKPANPMQKRFIEADWRDFLNHVEALKATLDGHTAWAGVAPHSVRALPLEYLREVAEWACRSGLPIHMHACEQPAELGECRAEHGLSPIALMSREGVLSERFTVVHGIHISEGEIAALAESGAMVCACPTTERNLGDGIVPAAALRARGVPIALGSDSNAQIDLLEDARELEYHLRLERLERGILCETDLFDSATRSGAASIGVPPDAADFFTVDLRDPSIAGGPRKDLLSAIVFGMNRTAVRDVIVGGDFVVRDGRHSLQDEITHEYITALQ